MKNKYAKFLRGLANKGSSTGFGVCILFETELEDSLHNILPYSVYESWEHFSGWEHYPVPSPSSDIGPEEAFNNLSRWEGCYGSLRRSWCLHLAEYFERLSILDEVREKLESTGHEVRIVEDNRMISARISKRKMIKVSDEFLNTATFPVRFLTERLTIHE